MEEPKKKKRRRNCDTHNVDLLIKIFDGHGGAKNYPEITRIYNEEMGKTEDNGWTQDQIIKKMQNVRSQIRSGKIQVVNVIATTENNQNDTEIDATGKNAPLCHICDKLTYRLIRCYCYILSES